jgi:hypothetical protein
MDRTVKSVNFSGLLLDHLGSRTQRAATSQVTDTKGNHRSHPRSGNRPRRMRFSTIASGRFMSAAWLLGEGVSEAQGPKSRYPKPTRHRLVGSRPKPHLQGALTQLAGSHQLAPLTSSVTVLEPGQSGGVDFSASGASGCSSNGRAYERKSDGTYGGALLVRGISVLRG